VLLLLVFLKKRKKPELLLSVLGVAFLGGAGSGLRYLASFWQGALPWGILVANTVASFVAGAAGSTGNFELAILVGFAGGLSTFSTFSAQSLSMLQNNQWISFIGHNSASIILCLLAIFLGQYLIKSLY
jgi:CrcB protein